MQPLIRDITRTIQVRLAREGDAAFILSLRQDEKKSRHLSSVHNSLSLQQQWLRDYLAREREGREYYFIIVDRENEPLGTVRLYDFREDSFCWGSWILKDGAPTAAAIESALMVYEIAFGRLAFQQSHFDVRKANSKVVEFHLRFGARIVGEDDLNYYFKYDKATYEATRTRYQRFLTPHARP